MNNTLFLNVSEWCFFFLWCLFIFIVVYFYIILFLNLIAFFKNKNNSFFARRYVPLVIKAKRIAVGLFQCSLAEDGTMFVLSYFCT